MKSKLVRLLGPLALMAFVLTGCSGGDDGAPGATGATGPAGAAGAAGATGPAGTSPTTVVSNSTTPTADSSAAWQALAPQITVNSVTIASPPVVKFTVKDANGNPVTGLGNKSQSSTAIVAGLTNIGFTLAKLVPGTNGSPSKWVSYNVLRPPTVAEKAGTVAATTSCDSTTAPTWCGTYPTTDAQGTLVDNGDGSYQYTFYRDPKQVAALAAGLIDTANGLNKKADLGDLTYDATLTHRLGIQLGGAAPGTGSNTPNAVTVTPGVNMVNTANVVYDFRPDGAAVTNTRDIVRIDSCASCHAGQVLAHGSRKDPKYCVTCHTDQIKYSFSMEAPSTNSGLTLTGGVTGTTAQKRAEQAVVDGRAVGNFPNFIHKLHMGEGLVKQGYNFNANGGAMVFNTVVLPQDPRNCTTCHDGSAKKSDGLTNANVTTDGDNWKKVPSRLACGACHDGINFDTGTGTTLAGATTGHGASGMGGPQTDDSKCSVCHTETSIPVSHINDDSTLNNPADAAGLKIFKYEIKSAAATASNVTVVFKITMDGTTPVTLLAPAAGMANPLTGFTGSPGFLLAYAKTQDGVASVDFNNLGNGQANAQPVSVSIANLLDTNKALTSGTLAGPDASGYYTATIVGAANIFPAGATLRTVALQSYFTQVTTSGNVARHALSVVKSVGTDTARRSVIDSNKCGNCHEWFLGHGGSRIIGVGSEGTMVCLLCHNPGLKTSGRGIPDATLLAYSFTSADTAILTSWGFDKTKTNAALNFAQVSNDMKDMIHGIHAAADRTDPIRIVRDRTPSAINIIYGAKIGYPGVLKNCEACHKSGTYSSVPANTLASTYEADNGVFLNGTSRTTADAKAALKQPNAQDKVTTPYAAACVSCHDKTLAKAHMTLNGGQILVLRSALNIAGESCAVCHGAGAIADPTAVHK